ncbi:hypothetical protein H6P87_01174 [Rickettsia tillamookensis]|uniref:Uncharacterized protein n=1 Tax=Rickettsia tillamookensis TaxID=2761623 RepID=A0A9E6SQY2_9RICK|nr:hypothetical protein [Rickettsia tillamookensis]QQV75611.1 hypothetical protein H6P87_01174 [Rickettsia tillamookensis]
MLKEIINDIVNDNTNPWYGKLAVVGACAVGIYVVVIDPPLKIAMACAAGIMGTLDAIKVGEACYNYYMETNTQEEGLIGEVEYNIEI